jgi:hypothetical protein
VSIVLKFGNLSLLEFSGPVQAYNGIALLLLVKERGSFIYCSFVEGALGNVHKIIVVEF